LGYSLIGERSATGYYPYIAGTVYFSYHNASLALARGNYPWAVRSDEVKGLVLDVSVYHHHVFYRDAFSDADNDGYTRCGCFGDGIGSRRSRYEDEAGVGTCLFYGLLYSVKYRYAEHLSASFAWGYPGHYLGAIAEAVLSMETALSAGDTLD
jgi:hypothetical protein